MTKVTNELLFEILKKVQSDNADIKSGIRDLKDEMIGVRRQLVAMQGDGLRQEQVIAAMQLDIDRIKTRLTLSDA